MLIIKIRFFAVGLIIAILTIFATLSTFILPRAARSRLNRLVFGAMRRVFEFLLRFKRTYEQRDAIMAYYSPISLIILVPVWYGLIMMGYMAMYWSLGVGNLYLNFRLSGSSLLTLDFVASDLLIVNLLAFSEALLGLLMVAPLMAYLPTMYPDKSRSRKGLE